MTFFAVIPQQNTIYNTVRGMDCATQMRSQHSSIVYEDIHMIQVLRWSITNSDRIVVTVWRGLNVQVIERQLELVALRHLQVPLFLEICWIWLRVLWRRHLPKHGQLTLAHIHTCPQQAESVF